MLVALGQVDAREAKAEPPHSLKTGYPEPVLEKWLKTVILPALMKYLPRMQEFKILRW
ncbi:MAG: hypothetical protein ACW981_20895 [Candidatus Hodarchaeales archaeon]